MLKNKFNLRNMVAIAICLAGMTTFFSCNKDKDKNSINNALEDEYFSVQNGTLHNGTIPSSASGISLENYININRKALPGGSSFVSIDTNNEISEIYVGVANAGSYYSINPQNQDSQGLRTTIINYSFIMLFSQNLNKSFEIQISAKLNDGSLTQLYTITIEYVKAETGSLQVNLSFNNNKDVDLYVVCPDGEKIYYANSGYFYEINGKIQGCGLDVDSNPGCLIDGINSENIFFSKESLQAGKYEVWINMFENCNSSIATNWIVTARHEGKLLSTNSGQNPAQGVFPIGTPSNSMGSFLSGATKVMEFTVAEGALRSSAISNIVQNPLTESAKIKLQKAGEIIE